MHDQPEPTREEEEQVPERQAEHKAMRAPGHENPTEQRPGRDDDGRDEKETHDG